MKRLFLLCLLAVLTPAAACPHCGDGIRQQVNAGIFNDRFLLTLCEALLPFAILALIVVLIDRWPRRAGDKR